MIILIIGPGFAGKTTELITQINKYKYYGLINTTRSSICFKKNMDIRYGIDNVITTHNKNIKVKCTIVNSYLDILNIGSKIDIIGIDELHFYDSKIQSVITKFHNDNKIVIITMLNGDYRQTGFQHNYIYSLASKIIYKKSSCYICGDRAPYTTALCDLNNQSTIVSDSGKIFQPCCKKHIKSWSVNNKTLICITGHNRVGKTTVGNMINKELISVYQTALADNVKSIITEIHDFNDNKINLTDKDLVISNSNKTPRDWCKFIGTKIRDKYLNKHIWCDVIFNKFIKSKKQIMLITDLCKKFEYEYFKSKFDNIIVIKVRKDVEDYDINIPITYTIYNNIHNKKFLLCKVLNIISKIKY